MKREIRQSMKILNLEVSAPTRATYARSICEKIETRDFFNRSETIALFASLPDEIPTERLLQRWASSKRLLIPRVNGDTMDFFEYTPSEIAEGSFGISEPQSSTPFPLEKIDLMIVPGVAFTLQGDRLGRGKGYYDKFLSSKLFKATTIGICYPHQVVETLPTEPHDVRLDYVIAATN